MIKHVIYHYLKKNTRECQAIVDFSESGEIDLNNEEYNALFTLIKNNYQNALGKRYGKFESDTINYPVPNILEEYLKEQKFEDFSKMMMKILEKNIKNESLAKGGYVVFIDYEENEHNYILIAIMNEIKGFYDDNWILKGRDYWSIDKMRYAGRIDLTLWQDTNNIENYVSFLKGKGEVSLYFKNFLGCNDIVDPKKETSKLVKNIIDFSKNEGLSLAEEICFFRNVNEYLKNLSEKGQALDLDHFSGHVYSEKAENLKEYLLVDSCGPVSTDFVPVKSELSNLTTINLQGEGWKLTFDRDLLDLTIFVKENQIIINEDNVKSLLIN